MYSAPMEGLGSLIVGYPVPLTSHLSLASGLQSEKVKWFLVHLLLIHASPVGYDTAIPSDEARDDVVLG